MTKIIKSASDYEDALIALEELLDLDPDEGTPEAEQLELLTLLIQDYESKSVTKELPDPIEAIQFRMDQQHLKNRDLVPYIGSPSKVSEVLSRKRPLTLSMIRALHTGLDIPAEVLLQEEDPNYIHEEDKDWHRFPIREMIDRGWIDETLGKTDPEKAIRDFLPKTNTDTFAIAFRKADIRSARSMDTYALTAWSASIINKAISEPPESKYEKGTVDQQFMREVAQLSWSASGPTLAQEFLSKHGISLIIEPHFPKTYLDGAAIRISKKNPIIGLTVRYDRIDNFWFCLLHELAHISLHMDNEDKAFFYDDHDIKESEDTREKDADKLAQDALIPEEAWEQSLAKNHYTAEAVEILATKLRIHPAIVVGRMHYESKSYRILNRWVGHRQVRKCFSEITWK